MRHRQKYLNRIVLYSVPNDKTGRRDQQFRRNARSITHDFGGIEIFRDGRQLLI